LDLQVWGLADLDPFRYKQTMKSKVTLKKKLFVNIVTVPLAGCNHVQIDSQRKDQVSDVQIETATNPVKNTISIGYILLLKS